MIDVLVTINDPIFETLTSIGSVTVLIFLPSFCEKTVSCLSLDTVKKYSDEK